MTEQNKSITKNNYIKVEHKIFPSKPGDEYILKDGAVYEFKLDEQDRSVYLEQVEGLALPKEIINTTDDEDFIQKVLKVHTVCDHHTTGVMLHGIKGSGKTVMMKQLAMRCGYPIIIANPNLSYDSMAKVLNAHDNPKGFVILFDEFEKYFGIDKALLTFLDGELWKFRKLCIFTANKIMQMDENLFQRPSRIRYMRQFNVATTLFVKEVMNGFGIKDEENKIYKFITGNFKFCTMDIVKTFLEEMKIFYPEGCTTDDMVALVKQMNIETKNDLKFMDATINDTISPATRISELLDIAKQNNVEKNKEQIMTEIGKTIGAIKEQWSTINLKSFND